MGPDILVDEMKIDLTPDLHDFVQTLATKNGITPEQVVVNIIQAEMDLIEAKIGRTAHAKINLALFDRTRHLGVFEQGQEAREVFNVNGLDERKGPFVVYVPDDMPTMPLTFFRGLFSRSIMVLGPTKFREHYVFDADVGNLVMIDRYIRTIWEQVKDTELFRISVGFDGEHDASFTVWLKIRDEVSLMICDETDVGDFLSRKDATDLIAVRQGVLIEDAPTQPED